MTIVVDPAGIERYVRATLWLGAAFNLGAAYVFSHPASAVGAYLGLAPHVDPLYAGLCALFVALFGGAYGWLALQRVLDQPLLWIGVMLRPDKHIFIERKAPWDSITDSLPQLDKAALIRLRRQNT
jgi:hypothetical protein